MILSDGFEQFAEQQIMTAPPSGWSVWGENVAKDRPKFIIDTTEAHSGKASFRIRHLPQSTSFAVLDPARAIRPQKKRAYTTVFWAKSNKETEMFFGINVYNAFQPKFERSLSPGYRPIHLSQKWKRFSFTFHEGLHFFVEGRSPHMLLTFLPKVEKVEIGEKIIWLDDVSVIESKNPESRRSADNFADTSVGLKHSLVAGNETSFVVDVTRRIRPCYREVAGISFWRLYHPVQGPFNVEGRYFLDPMIEQSIRELRLPMTRLFGVADEAPALGKRSGRPWTVEDSIDRVAVLCEKTGIPNEWVFIELENPDAHTSLPPEVWGRAVKYSRKKGYSFRYWEVSNEPYAIFGKKRVAFPAPEDYLQHFLPVSRAIHEEDPEAQVGISIAKDNPMWSSYLLREAAGSYDFVVPHLYTFPGSPMSKEKFSNVVLTENAKVLISALELNARIRDYNPQRPVPILDTEWGLHGGDLHTAVPGFVNRDSNIWASVHDAVRLIYYAREGLVRGASAWSMLSPNQQNPGLKFLFADAPEQSSIRYWFYYYFLHHLGEWVVQLDGSSPFFRPGNTPEAFAMPMTPAIATISEDGRRLFFIIANGGWDEGFDCRVHIRGFRPKHVSAVLFSDFRNDASTAHPLLERKEEAIRDLDFQIEKEDLRFELPGHSVALIELRKD